MNRVEEIARAYWRAEESRDPDQILEFFTEDATWRGPGTALAGREQIQGFYAQSAAQFPGLRVQVGRVHGDDREAAIEWTAVFTDASGREHPLEGTNIMRVEGDRIAELTTYNDPSTLGNVPERRFVGKHVVVTGAGSGIGAATVHTFVHEGARVLGVDINAESLDRVQAGLGTSAASFTPYVADVTDVDAHERMLSAASGPDGEIDVLVNNAAVFLLAGVDATAQDWQRTLDVNVVAPARLVAAATDALGRSRSGSVVNLASVSGHVSQANRWTYNSGKGATLSLTRCQALDLASRGIRVNSVSPGYIWTEVLDRGANGDREKWEPVWGSYCPMRRCGEPSEVASAIAFLASESASFITGADLLVDGGLVSMSPDGLSSYDFSS